VERLTRSATNAITAVTALAWLVALALGKSEQAALGLGFIPARLSGIEVPWPALPAVLTPLSATLVHSGLIVLYLVGAYAAALAQWGVAPMATVPMVGASGAISAVIGAFALSFGRPRQFTRSQTLNRWINAAWLLIAWVVLQVMMGWLAGGQGYLLATPAHVGGFAAGLVLQRPLLLWRYRRA
jgi:membrane associated rhomboid family serine protease